MRIFLIAVPVLLCGCFARWYNTPETIEIVSEPSGARIEINDDYLGEAPLTTHFARGGYHGNANPLKINAMPVRPGDCMQSKLIPEDVKAPRRILFDMTICEGRKQKQEEILKDTH